ncbi:MAG: poly-gamma-glutamate hydrolase family protein [Gammaproteobacteria bacterium]
MSEAPHRPPISAATDTYTSFAELEVRETHGTDYRVRMVERPDAPVVILAPHGGGIEVGTSQLAARIARGRHSLFLFEGLKPPWQNRGLHITSHRFDHPLCVALVSRHPVTLAVHGCRGESRIYVGGLDTVLKTLLAAKLNDAGFSTTSDNHPYMGLNPLNICNRGSRGRGVQIELTRDFREPIYRRRIAPLIREALDEYLGTTPPEPKPGRRSPQSPGG